MFKNFNTKMPKILAFALALALIIGMIPATAFSASALVIEPSTVAIQAVDAVTGLPIEGAKVSFAVFDNTLGEDVLGDADVETDADGKIVIMDTIPGDVMLREVSVTHADYAPYTNSAYNQAIDALDDVFVIQLTPVIKGVTVTANTLTYDGTAQESVAITGTVAGDVVAYTVNGDSSADGKLTDAGEYAVEVTVSRAGYADLVKPVVVTVAKKDLDFSIAAVEGLQYNETEQELVSLTGSFLPTDTVTWIVNEQDTGSRDIPEGLAAGAYTVQLIVERDNNYNKFESDEITVNIGLANLNIDGLSITAVDNLVYNGEEQALLTVDKNEGDYDLEYSFTNEDGSWVKNEILKGKDAGTYTVYVKATKVNYEDKETEAFPITVTIKKADLSFTVTEKTDLVYNGNDQELVVLDSSEFKSGDTATWTVTSFDQDGNELEKTWTVEGEDIGTKDLPTGLNAGEYTIQLIVERDDNCNMFDSGVIVAEIAKADQSIAFSGVPQTVIYNENNQFRYGADYSTTLNSGKPITYSIVDGDAEGAATATVIEKADPQKTEEIPGTVTYTSTGAVKVKATVAESDNFNATTAEYELTIVYADAPQLEVTTPVTTIDGWNWYAGNVTITPEAGWKIAKDYPADPTDWQDVITESAEGAYDGYTAVCKNAAGELTDKIPVDAFAIDLTAPAEKNALRVDFDEINDDPAAKTINFLTFGLFYNEAIQVTVTCDDTAKTDGAPGSGVKEILLVKCPVNGAEETVAPDSGKTNVFTLPVGFMGTVKVQVTDYVGNTSDEIVVADDNIEETPTDDKNGKWNGYIEIEDNKPVVTITFNNNNVTNGNFYDAPRTATITVTERNFDSSLVEITQTAKLDGVDIAQPALSQWKTEGDVHTATIVYNKDGDYNLTVKVTDYAGNVTTVATGDFTIDQTIKTPVIGGVENGGAYKEDVIPTVSFEDVNYDSYTIKLLRTRKDEKNVDVTSQYIKNIAETEKGISGVFDTFEKIVENDGIYTLSVQVTDKAGNTSSATCTFVVNRFGSVYEYSDNLIDLIKDGGQYVTGVEHDLVITEYNADKLLEGSLKILITRDGQPIEAEYMCAPEINDAAPIGESGWYEYVYVIKASNFEQDGVYKISLTSAYATDDAEKNESTSVPENSTDPNGKNVVDTMTFTVDATAPDIRNIVNLDNPIVNAQTLNVKYTIVDVGGLKMIEVLLNGQVIDTITEFADGGFTYNGEFVINEDTKTQNVQIRVTDLAGNVTDTASADFTTGDRYVFNPNITVSTNIFVRWFANKGLFWGSIGGVVIVAAVICFLFAKKKKKEEE